MFCILNFFSFEWSVIILQVPSLEHNNEIIMESLDLIKYIDSNFEGPNLSPSVRLEDVS